VAVPVPGKPCECLRWGDQLDVRPVYVSAELDGMSDHRVAAYVAKYATKGAESAGTVDRPIKSAGDVGLLPVTDHARRMIYTCFALSRLPQYREIPLRQWAHMLGYRGHFSTKSRRYSTTLGALPSGRNEVGRISTNPARADVRLSQTHQPRSRLPSVSSDLARMGFRAGLREKTVEDLVSINQARAGQRLAPGRHR
jgi:hypothetical protein